MDKPKEIPITIEVSRCPTGCCLNLIMRHVEGEELKVVDVQTMFGLLAEVFAQKGLPPKMDTPPIDTPEAKKGKHGKLELVH